MTYPTDQPLLPTRSLASGQMTQVWVVDIDNGVPELVYSNDELLLEAPNWAPGRQQVCYSTATAYCGGWTWSPRWRWLRSRSRICRRSTTTTSSISPRSDLSLGQRRPPLCRPARGRHRHPAHPRLNLLPFPARHQPRRRTLAFVDLPRGDLTAAGRLALMPAAGGETTYPAAGSRTSTAPSTHPTAPGST